MKLQFLASQCVLVAIAAAALIAPVKAADQSGLAGVEKAAAALTPKNWAPPRTPDGRPDLQGIYTNVAITPLERPAEFAEKPFFSPQEAVAFEKRVVDLRNRDRRDGGGEADVLRAYNELWWDSGTKVARTLQTSLIVDPPDGKIPSLTPEAKERLATRAAEIKEKCQDPGRSCPIGNDGRAGLADAPEDRPLMERCILWATGGPPMLPSAYNNNYAIVQTPDYVMIYIEMVHDYRIIPLDGRPHVAQDVRQLMGDSRGHWEGNTLVVDTTNFSDQTNFRGAGRNMHLTERFTRVAPDGILYEFTVDDPTTFTRPWSGAVMMNKAEGPIYEFACHEGNHGLEGILSGARAEEKRRAASVVSAH